MKYLFCLKKTKILVIPLMIFLLNLKSYAQQTPSDKYQKFAGLLLSYYVDSIEKETINNLAMEGIIKNLPPNIEYIDKDSIQDFPINKDSHPDGKKSVFPSKLGGNIIYFRIDDFSEEILNNLHEGTKLIKHKEDARFIIDLRQCIVGDVKVAAKLLNEFIGSFQVLFTKIDEGYKKQYYCIDGGNYISNDIVVLVGENSGLTAELFAGSLQYLDRAVIIGMPTKGNGCFGKTVRLYDGSILKFNNTMFFSITGDSLFSKDMALIRSIRKKYTKGFKNNILPVSHLGLSDAYQHISKTHSKPIYSDGNVIPDLIASFDLNLFPQILNQPNSNKVATECANIYLSQNSLKPAFMFNKEKYVMSGRGFDHRLVDMFFEKMGNISEIIPFSGASIPRAGTHNSLGLKTKDSVIHQNNEIVKKTILARAAEISCGKMVADKISISADPCVQTAKEVLVTDSKYQAVLEGKQQAIINQKASYK